MKDLIWKSRTWIMLLGLLFIQIVFFFARKETADHETIKPMVEVINILVTSGLFFSLTSKGFERWMERKIYGGFRKNWREVRVMYSDNVSRGAGPEFPREPTLLIHPPIHSVFSNESEEKNFLHAYDRKGQSIVFTAIQENDPLLMSFNNSYVGIAKKGDKKTGKWSEMEIMLSEVMSKTKIVRVGFPQSSLDIQPLEDRKD